MVTFSGFEEMALYDTKSYFWRSILDGALVMRVSVIFRFVKIITFTKVFARFLVMIQAGTNLHENY